MAEIERTRERERPPLGDNPYERVMRSRAEQLERNKTGPIVVRKSERAVLPVAAGQAALLPRTDHPSDTPLQMWRVFTHEIRTKSGRHLHQGGLVIYVLEGKGYSIVEGERLDWEKGDLVLLPLHPNEVEHQHFNLDPDKPSVWCAHSSTCRSKNIWRPICSRWKIRRTSRDSVTRTTCLLVSRSLPRHARALTRASIVLRNDGLPGHAASRRPGNDAEKPSLISPTCPACRP